MPSRLASPDDRALLELAAHDLRNPLSGVLTATQLLIEDAGPVLKSDQLTLLRTIESAAQFMLRLVDDMVELPQLGARNLKLDRHAIEVGLLVEHVAAANRPLAEDRKIKLEVGVRRPRATVRADPVKFVRALEALLTSAIRFSDPGSRIELLVDVDTEHVVVTLRHEDHTHGHDTLRSLFNPSLPKRAKRGLTEERAALTLAYARGIVEAHHGTLQLETVRKGTSAVVISLPASGRAKSRHQPKPAGRKGQKTFAAGGNSTRH